MEVRSPIPRRSATLDSDPDLPLVAASLDGDREAFGELFLRHQRRVRQLLLSVVGPFDELDDLTQDVFTAAYLGLSKFRRNSAFSTWLHGIAVRKAYDHIRQAKRGRARLRLGALDDVPQPRAHDAERAIDRSRLIAELYAILDEIGDRRRVALTLFAIEGLSIAQVARVMGISNPAAKSLIWFARRAVRNRSKTGPDLRPLLEAMVDR